jgi:hypothetical protein
MAVSIAILNRQRRFSVDPRETEKTIALLAQGVLDNLRANGVPRLKKRDLDDMS